MLFSISRSLAGAVAVYRRISRATSPETEDIPATTDDSSPRLPAPGLSSTPVSDADASNGATSAPQRHAPPPARGLRGAMTMAASDPPPANDPLASLDASLDPSPTIVDSPTVVDASGIPLRPAVTIGEVTPDATTGEGRARLFQAAFDRVAENVDEAFSQIVLGSPLASRRAAAMTHQQRMEMLQYMARFYERVARTKPDFFGKSAAAQVDSRRVRNVRRNGQRGEVFDLRWPSDFEPLWPDDVRAKYLSQPHNRKAHARWIRHGDRPRPTIILLHGYMGGTMLIEERMWPIGRWFDLGFDMVLSCLPFHGLRADPSRRWAPPRFPANDPRFTVEGFRQLIFDHRTLIDYLLEGRATEVGMMGMSLGGYATTLLATVESRLRFAVPVIPLASIASFAHDRGRLFGSPSEQRELREALAAVYRTVDPLARPSLLQPEGTLVVAGRCDRVTPLEHAQRVARHLEAPLVLFDGGHLLQRGRFKALQEAEQMLRRLDLMP